MPDSFSGPPLTIKHLLIDKKTDFPQWSLSHKKFCPFSNLWRKFYFCFYCDFKRANVEWLKNHFTSEKADFDPLCLKRHKGRKKPLEICTFVTPFRLTDWPFSPQQKNISKKKRVTEYKCMLIVCVVRSVLSRVSPNVDRQAGRVSLMHPPSLRSNERSPGHWARPLWCLLC